MLISHKHKWIFIHIPKNGGSSATRALNSYADVEGASHYELMEGLTPKNDRIDLSFFQHDTASMIKEKLKEQGYDYDSYYKFGIARNPWSRIVSKWTYWHKLTEQGSTFAYAHYVCDKFKTFREFIEFDGRGNMRQTDYIFDNNNIQRESLKNIPPGVKKRRNWITTRRVRTEKPFSTNTLLVDRIVHLDKILNKKCQIPLMKCKLVVISKSSNGLMIYWVHAQTQQNTNITPNTMTMKLVKLLRKNTQKTSSISVINSENKI